MQEALTGTWMTRTWTLRLSRLSYAHAPKNDAIRGCDPYFKITVGGVERKTSVKKNACEGVWPLKDD